MFGSRDQHAMAHQTGRVADPRHMTPARWDLKILEVGPDKHNAGGNGRGENTDANGNSAMKPHPRRLNRTVNRGLESQASSPDPMSLFQQLSIESSSV